MKTYGNVDGLKKEIESKYETEINKVKWELGKKTSEFEAEASKESELIREQAKTDAEASAREAKQRVMNEEKLKAKRKFEEAREKMIQKVFDEIKKEAPKIAVGKEYLAFAKKNAPKEKGLEVYGSSSAYKKVFSKMKTNNSIIGLKFVSENMVYDLSLDGAIEANEELVRRIITKKLFGE